MTFSLSLFLIGVLGFILNRKNIILLIISLEIMLLAINLYSNSLNWKQLSKSVTLLNLNLFIQMLRKLLSFPQRLYVTESKIS